MYKLISLNLKGIQVNEKRYRKLIKILKQLDPDIIIFQEVRNQKENILSEINLELKDPFKDFQECFNYSKNYGKGIFSNDNIIEGLGVIAKIKFDAKKINLPIQKGIDRWPRIAQLCDFKEFNLTNVHLSKYEKSRDLEWKKLPKNNILIGDFNMRPDELNKRKGELKSSYEFRKYISFPSEKDTFDYCLLPYGEFLKLKLIKDISDHNGLYLEVDF